MDKPIVAPELSEAWASGRIQYRPDDAARYHHAAQLMAKEVERLREIRGAEVACEWIAAMRAGK